MAEVPRGQVTDSQTCGGESKFLVLWYLQ